MAEKEYIERDKAIDACFNGWNNDAHDCAENIRQIPAADVRPVVTCERCVYHVDCGYHYCNKWCVNCPDDADFFCAYGEEKS